jgi:hypothetical protein
VGPWGHLDAAGKREISRPCRQRNPISRLSSPQLGHPGSQVARMNLGAMQIGPKLGADLCWSLLIPALRNSPPAVACIDQDKENGT